MSQKYDTVEKNILKSLENEQFRQQLLHSPNPKDTLERQLGTPLPKDLKVEALQGRPTTAQARRRQCESIDYGDYIVNICREGGRIVVLEVIYEQEI
jgi:hypothetical protein